MYLYTGPNGPECSRNGALVQCFLGRIDLVNGEGHMLNETKMGSDAVDLQRYWQAEYVRIDRIFIKLLIAQFIGLICVALVYTPKTWIGDLVNTPDHIYGSLTIAFVAVLLAFLFVLSRSGTESTRYVIAISQMILSSVLIHLTGGRVETHFHILGSLAFLSFYKDWRILVASSIYVVCDHVVREIYWPQSLYGVSATSGFRWLEHTWWIVFADVFLMRFCMSSKQDTDRLITAECNQRDLVANINNMVEDKTNALSKSVKELDRLAFIIKKTENVVFMLSEDGLIEWVNDAFVGAYEQDAEGVLGRSYIDLMRADDLDIQSLSIIEVFIEQHMYSMGDLVTTRRRAGKKRFYEHEFLARETAGGTKEMVVIEKDRTQSVQAQERARVAFEESEIIMDSFSGGVVGVDNDGLVFKWEAKTSEYLGLGKMDAVGKRFLDLNIGIDVAQLSEFIANFNKNRNSAKNTIELPSEFGEDGSTMLLFNIHGIKSGSHRGGYMLVSINVTERKSLERQLYHAQKMEAVGQLAAGVAHEINTPIQFIGDNLRFFKDSFDDMCKLINDCSEKISKDHVGFSDEYNALLETADFEYLSTEIPEAVDQSLEGVDRVAKIIRAMKDFSHPGENEKEETDIGACIHGAVTMSKNEYKYCADVHIDVADDLPHVSCNKNEIVQVLLILVVNAAHAIQEVLKKGEVERGLIEIRAGKIGEELAISVKDSGNGVEKSIQGKIFDAFFTTKEVGKGTGQGLSLAHTIVHQNHGGRIELESEIGSGTTFTIFLPLGVASTEVPEVFGISEL